MCVGLIGPRDRRIHDRFVGMANPPEAKLRSLFRTLRARLPLNESVDVPLGELGKAWGRGAGVDEVLPALEVLGRCGALSLELQSPSVNPGRGSGARSGAQNPCWNSPRDPGTGHGHSASITLTLLASSLRLDPLGRLRAIAQAQVESVLDYARGRGCRRRKLLAYFGEEEAERRCGRCDRCRAGLGGKLKMGLGTGAGLFARGPTR